MRCSTRAPYLREQSLTTWCVLDDSWKTLRHLLLSVHLTSLTLPSRQVPMPNYAMHGFPGPGDGVGDVSGNSWSNNMTALVWTIQTPFITLNSTVYHTLNTSGRAPRNWPQDGPSMPGPAIVPSARGDTVVFYHNGHETNKCTPNYDGVVDWLVSSAMPVRAKPAAADVHLVPPRDRMNSDMMCLSSLCPCMAATATLPMRPQVTTNGSSSGSSRATSLFVSS